MGFSSKKFRYFATGLNDYNDFKQSAMLLVRSGADVTALSPEKGSSLLHALVVTITRDVYFNTNFDENHLEISELIAINKEILNCRNSQGRTPVHALLMSDSDAGIEAIEKLLSDTNLHFTDNDGATLLHVACRTGNFSAVKYFFAKNLSLSARTLSKETLLHCAVYYRNEELIQWLIATKQIDINLQDIDGETALHRAVCRSNPTAVRILLAHGADATIQNKAGLNAFQRISKYHGHDLQVHLLKASIQAMHDYGISLQNQETSVGQLVVVLAHSLSEKANDFFDQKPEEQSRNINIFQLEFSELLNSKNEEMNIYSIAWNIIVKNIAIALTGIGLLFIAAQLVYSKVTQGRPLLFFQENKTPFEKRVENVEHCIDVMVEGVLELSV